MGFFDRFPYTDFHKLNLDWIIDKVKECIDSFNNLENNVNTTLKNQNTKIDKISENVKTEVAEEVKQLGNEGFFDETIERLFTKTEYLDTLKNKKILVFGDSISDNTFRSYNKWTYYLSEIAKNITGCEVKNVSTAGYELKRVIQNINSETGFTPDIIVVFAGINDYRYNTALGSITDSSTTTFNGCLNYMRNLFRTKYPDARVFFVSPLKNATTTNSESSYIPFPLYVGAISERCKSFGWEFIDAYNNAPMLSTNTNYTKYFDSNDGTAYLHPNVSYSPILCNFILGCLISGHGIPLSEITEVLNAEKMATMGFFSNVNSVFTPSVTGNTSFCAVKTNGWEIRVSYNLESGANSNYATIMKLPPCLAPYLNKITTVATKTLTASGALTSYGVQINNTGTCYLQGGSTATTGLSFTAVANSLYYVTNR